MDEGKGEERKRGKKKREEKVKKAGKSEFKSRDYYSRDSNQHLKVNEYLGDEENCFYSTAKQSQVLG